LPKEAVNPSTCAWGKFRLAIEGTLAVIPEMDHRFLVDSFDVVIVAGPWRVRVFEKAFQFVGWRLG